MNGVVTSGIIKPVKPQRLALQCSHAGCAAVFPKQWKLKRHLLTHSGARPFQCKVEGCGRRFRQQSHLSRHALRHSGIKQYKCTAASCTASFFDPNAVKRHVRYAHGDKEVYFKCNQPKCSLTFKKRRAFKMHVHAEHGVTALFKCSKAGCRATFDSHTTRKSHEKRHTGYRCPHDGCEVLERTWGKLQKHTKKHPVTYPCKVCKKEFKRGDSLRRHKRSHASHKPVLLCPRTDCQAYFSTTFNLQHHIHKVHFKLLKYSCSFPDCPQKFAMRESMTRHLRHHDPGVNLQKKRQRAKKSWQKRLHIQHRQPLVEDDLRHLFALRLRIARRAKVEANLSGLFNERKIPHFVDPEVNLRNLFSLKQQRLLEPKPEVLPLAV